MPYAFHEYVKAWAKSALGLMIAILIGTLFSSVFIGFLTFAFLCFVPIQNDSTEKIINRSFFGLLMLVLLFWAFGFGGFPMGLGLELGISWTQILPSIALFLGLIGFGIAAGITRKGLFVLIAFACFVGVIFIGQPWTWNASAIIFIGVWLVSLAIGVSADPQSKAAAGVLIIILAFVLFAGGIGTQEVGTAFFGQWWPTVYNLWSGISEPLFNAFTPLIGTIGNAWMLMSNPIGYATQLMNGSYASNPLGQTGVHGADIISFDVSRAYVNQPFMISAVIKNNGASKATELSAKLSIDQERLGIYKGATDIKGLSSIDKIGITTASQPVGSGALEKASMAQIVFQSSTGVNCDLVNSYDIRKKVIPLKLETTYKYSSDSHVSIEFIKQSEWDRLTNENKLNLKDVQSEYSSAPVKFPIGTAGLKQPIIAGFQEFNIGLRLDAEATNSKIKKVTKVELDYPADFKIKGKCTPEGAVNEAEGKVVWDNLQGEGTKILFCNFEKLANDEIGNSATKTYEITAHAEYEFSNWKTADLALEFGGVCCSKEDCISGQVCHDCTCVPETEGKETGCEAGGGGTATDTCTPNGGTCREAPDDPNTAPCQQGEKLFTVYTCPKSGSGKAQNCCKVESIPPSNESVPPTPTP